MRRRRRKGAGYSKAICKVCLWCTVKMEHDVSSFHCQPRNKVQSQASQPLCHLLCDGTALSVCLMKQLSS